MRDELHELRQALEREPLVAYALAFGSAVRGPLRSESDLDVAVELFAGSPRDPHVLGGLAARLETATGRAVDLVSLEDAPSPLSFRIFRDGVLLIERDHAALTSRKARAILHYLDFKPIEDRCTAGVLRAAARHGR